MGSGINSGNSSITNNAVITLFVYLHIAKKNEQNKCKNVCEIKCKFIYIYYDKLCV